MREMDKNEIGDACVRTHKYSSELEIVAKLLMSSKKMRKHANIVMDSAKLAKDTVRDFYNDINCLDGRKELIYGELIDCNNSVNAKKLKDMFMVIEDCVSAVYSYVQVMWDRLETIVPLRPLTGTERMEYAMVKQLRIASKNFWYGYVDMITVFGRYFKW